MYVLDNSSILQNNLIITILIFISFIITIVLTSFMIMNIVNKQVKNRRKYSEINHALKICEQLDYLQSHIIQLRFMTNNLFNNINNINNINKYNFLITNLAIYKKKYNEECTYILSSLNSIVRYIQFEFNFTNDNTQSYNAIKRDYVLVTKYCLRLNDIIFALDIYKIKNNSRNKYLIGKITHLMYEKVINIENILINILKD